MPSETAQRGSKKNRGALGNDPKIERNGGRCGGLADAGASCPGSVQCLRINSAFDAITLAASGRQNPTKTCIVAYEMSRLPVGGATWRKLPSQLARFDPARLPARAPAQGARATSCSSERERRAERHALRAGAIARPLLVRHLATHRKVDGVAHVGIVAIVEEAVHGQESA